jgi:serine/threonine protein phosphatase 1
MIAAVRALFSSRKKPAPVVEPPRRARLDIPTADTVVYAIGDVHGCLKELKAAEAAIMADAAHVPAQRRIILLLGDLIDRGPQSAEVLDHLIAPPPAGFERMSLCGNHDETFLSFVEDPQSNMGWLEFGGEETLESYGIDMARVGRQGAAGLANSVRAAVPESHLAFVRDLPVSVRFGDVLFVHAGIRPGVPIDEQDEDDFMWIREPFLSVDNGLGLIVVHGHTPVPEPTFATGRIGIDTGAYATGRLTALRIHEGMAAVIC